MGRVETPHKKQEEKKMVRTPRHRDSGRGWHNQSDRHKLARMGIKTAVKDSPNARVQLQKSVPFTSQETDLQAEFDSRDSFYGKAQIITTPTGSKLQSYSTIVAEIKDGVPVVHGAYSPTTTRHIKEYLKQNGFEVESTKQVLKDYKKTDWKKHRKDTIWVNDKTGLVIDVGEGYDTKKKSFDKDRIVLNITKNHKLIENKSFKSKSKALKFAENYMESH